MFPKRVVGPTTLRVDLQLLMRAAAYAIRERLARRVAHGPRRCGSRRFRARPWAAQFYMESSDVPRSAPEARDTLAILHSGQEPRQQDRGNISNQAGIGLFLYQLMLEIYL